MAETLQYQYKHPDICLEAVMKEQDSGPYWCWAKGRVTPERHLLTPAP